MGRTRKLLGLAALAALIGPPIAAAMRKRDARDEGGESSDEVRIGAYFEGRQFTSHATSFRAGTFESWYSGLDVDLRDATLDPAGATIAVKAFFSGVRVVVPEGWRIELHPRAIAGGVTDDTDGGTIGGPLLTVQASAVFGGVQVTTRAEAAWMPGIAGGHSENGHGGNGRASGLAVAEQQAATEAANEAAGTTEGAEAGEASRETEPAAVEATAEPAAVEATAEPAEAGPAEEPAS
jgi:hypothetical protein